MDAEPTGSLKRSLDRSMARQEGEAASLRRSLDKAVKRAGKLEMSLGRARAERSRVYLELIEAKAALAEAEANASRDADEREIERLLKERDSLKAKVEELEKRLASVAFADHDSDLRNELEAAKIGLQSAQEERDQLKVQRDAWKADADRAWGRVIERGDKCLALEAARDALRSRVEALEAQVRALAPPDSKTIASGRDRIERVKTAEEIAAFVVQEVHDWLPNDTTTGVRRGASMLSNMILARWVDPGLLVGDLALRDRPVLEDPCPREAAPGGAA